MGKRQSWRAATAASAALVTTALAATLLTATAPTAAAATTTFTPVADTYVQDTTPSTNYGTSTQFVADNSPVRQAFLKFTVAGVTAPVTGAKLRVRSISGNSGASKGGVFKSVSSTTWSETGTTWNNKPAQDGATLATLGAVTKDTWYEVDVTSVVKGNGTFSFGVSSTSSDGAYYDTRESGADAPQLVLTTSGPSPSPSASPSASPTVTPTPTPTPTVSPSPSPSPTQPTGDPVLVGAGDIADSGSGDTATAALLDKIPGTVFTAGDNVYTNGTTSEFASYYEPTWGRHKARTRPAPGNHDYNTSGATGYYTYFGANAGDPAKGYYSYDLGNWHVVALNSNIAMSAGSAQETWLRGDLAASTKPCTLAYWHHPLYTSSSSHAPSTATRPLYQALYDYNAEVVVTGHNHTYERFAPQDANGNRDDARGLRSFVAGMGGASFYGFGTIQNNSEARNADTWGVLKFTLHDSSYDYEFVPQAGKTYNDKGTGTCH